MNGVCKECGKKRAVGDVTNQCLECLDWKWSDASK